MDYRRGRDPQPPVSINGAVVERVETFKYLGVNIHEGLKWEAHTAKVVAKAQQRLYGLRRLKKFGLSQKVIRNFYRGTVESLLTSSFTSWFGSCTDKDHKALRRVVRSAERITGCRLPSLEELYTQRCLTKAKRIIKDPTHPQNRLFHVLPSGRRYRSLKASTTRLKNSFFPQAVRLLNEEKCTL